MVHCGLICCFQGASNCSAMFGPHPLHGRRQDRRPPGAYPELQLCTTAVLTPKWSARARTLSRSRIPEAVGSVTIKAPRHWRKPLDGRPRGSIDDDVFVPSLAWTMGLYVVLDMYRSPEVTSSMTMASSGQTWSQTPQPPQAIGWTLACPSTMVRTSNRQTDAPLAAGAAILLDDSFLGTLEIMGLLHLRREK